MSTKPFVFLSYADADADFALRLAADLKNQGVRLFIDRLNVHPGEDREGAARHAFSKSAGVIAVLSPAGLADPACADVLSAAGVDGRLLVPVVRRAMSAAEWPTGLDPAAALDFRDDSAYLARRADLLYTLREREPRIFAAAPTPMARYLNSLIAGLERANLSALTLPDASARPWLDPDVWFLAQPFELLPSPGAMQHGSSPVLPDIWHVVEAQRRLLLVGAPDSGKSTILRQLTLHAAWHAMAAPEAARLPIFVQAVDWPADADVATFLRARWPLDNDPVALLLQGKAILFIDDIGSTADGAAAAARLQTWLDSDDTTDVALIATCSQASYDRGLPLILPAARLAPPARDRVARLVAATMGPQAGARALARIIWNKFQAAYQPPGLQQYLFHPYLLPLLARVGREESAAGSAAPDGYSIGALLERLAGELWELRQPQATLTWEAVQAGLADLALAALRDDLPVYMPRERALRHLRHPALLQPENVAGFLIVDETHVRFAHYLLRLYFAALGLRATPLEKILTSPVFNAAEERVSQAFDPAIVMLAGLAPDPDETVNAIAEIDPYLALECVYGGLALGEATVQGLARRLMTSSYVQSGQGRVSAVRLLPASAHQTGIPLLLETMRSGAWDARLAASRTLATLETASLPGLEDALLALAGDARASVEWLRQWGEATLPALQVALRGTEAPFRIGAVRALAALGDPAAVPVLVDLLFDADPTLRAEAARALPALHDPQVYRPLADLLLASIGQDCESALRAALDGLGADALHTLLDDARHAASEDERQRLLAALRLIGPPYIQEQIERMMAGDTRAASEPQNRRSEGTMFKRLIQELFRGGAHAPASDTAVLRDGLSPTVQQEEEAQPLAAAASSARRARERLEQIVENREPAATITIGSRPATSAAADWTSRRDAVLAMAKQPHKIAIPRLATALRDSDSLVRVAAVQTLSIFTASEESHAQAMEALYAALADEDDLVRDTAADVLRAVGRPAIPYLLRALESKDANTRGVAVEKLGEIGDPSAIDALTGCLDDMARPHLSEKSVSELAAQALQTIGTRESLGAVLTWQAAHAADPRTAELFRQASQDIMSGEVSPAQLAIDERLQQLLKAVIHEDWSQQKPAMQDLKSYAKAIKTGTIAAEVDVDAVKRQLVSAARDADWRVRAAGAEALGWIASPSTMPALVELLQDPNWSVQVEAIRALVEFQDPEAVPYIAELLDEPREAVREAAALAIGELGGKSTLAVNRLGQALDDEKVFVRLAAIFALGRLGDDSFLDRLVQGLEDPDVNIRWTTAEALGLIAAPGSVPALIKVLNDDSGPYYENQKVGEIAAQALQKIGTPEALEALVDRQGEQTASVR